MIPQSELQGGTLQLSGHGHSGTMSPDQTRTQKVEAIAALAAAGAPAQEDDSADRGGSPFMSQHASLAKIRELQTKSREIQESYSGTAGDNLFS